MNTFTEDELRATDDAGHRPWHDGYCQCWVDAGFSGEAHLFNVDHLIDVMRAAR